MDCVAVGLVATLGPLAGTFALDAAPALVSAAVVLFALAVAGAIVLLAVRDRRRALPPLRPEIALAERRDPVRWSA